eukprot:jgi/Chrpa1/9854/Chrysochromulina_OHIO_Genome00015246-RA
MVILHARSVLLLFTVPLMSAVEGYPGRRDVLPNAYSSEYGQQFYDNVGHVGGFRYSLSRRSQLQNEQVDAHLLYPELDGAEFDYTDSVRASIVDSFAAAANVPASSVRLTVTSGSVRLSLSIAAATLAAAQTVEAALAPVLSSAANASALLPPSLSVTATPVVQLIDSSQSTPPVAVAPRLVSRSVPVGAIIAIAVAVGVVALGTALWFALRAGWCKRVQATVDAMPPKCANSPKTQTSMEHTNGIQTVA